MKISKRNLLRSLALSPIIPLIYSCEKNPITGRSELSFISKEEEIQLDKESSKFQFSNDYGTIQDKEVNNYINTVGQSLAKVSHRPDMPYSFRGVNAVYVNAYAFPGGSIAITRGMLVNLESEAELAATLGHEIGHVAARHTARVMSKGLVLGGILTGLLIYLTVEDSPFVPLASTAAGIGSSLLLAKYSRDDERQADALGMEYMVRAMYNPDGMIQLMNILKSLEKDKPSMIETMFATHPMSEERYEKAIALKNKKYLYASSYKLYKERFMDNTANIRKIKSVIENLQNAMTLIAKKNINEAENLIKKSLSIAPDDYAALLIMAKCKNLQKNYTEAYKYALEAKNVYTNEGQAHYLLGLICIKLSKYEEAINDFNNYDRLLSGNPEILFYKGYCYDKLEDVANAIKYYSEYLQKVDKGNNANYARQRINILRMKRIFK
jgi:predicted Zn-dependent protease